MAGTPATDVLDGYEVVLRIAQPRWYSRFFGAGVDFYQRPPMPVVQVVWPDRDGMFPWDSGVDEWCQQSQPQLWIPPDDHPPGQWTRHDPFEDWPFRESLPYFTVHASADVAAGTVAIGTVLRDGDGTWWFLSADANPGTTEQVQLRQIADANPDVAAVADLQPGERADRSPDGGWSRRSHDRPA